MRSRVKLLLALGVVVAGIGYLLVTGMSGATAYYVTVDELLARSDEFTGRSVRVMGNLVGDSIRYDPAGPLLQFQIAGVGGGGDGDGSGARLAVNYRGIQPDQMNDGWEAIVEGRLGPDGTLLAEKVMIKCPSRYESAPPGSYQGGRAGAGQGARPGGYPAAPGDGGGPW